MCRCGGYESIAIGASDMSLTASGLNIVGKPIQNSVGDTASGCFWFPHENSLTVRTFTAYQTTTTNERIQTGCANRCGQRTLCVRQGDAGRDFKERYANREADLRRLDEIPPRGMEKRAVGKRYYAHTAIQLYDWQEFLGQRADHRCDGHPLFRKG